MTSKMFQHVTGFYEKVIKKGMLLMSQASDIYFIGYQGKDDTFEELYRQAPDTAKLHVVTRGDAKEILDRVVRIMGRIEVVEPNTNGFEDFVKYM